MTQEQTPAAPAAPELFVSYSLNQEDVLLNRFFRGRQSGFFVDVGAGHPQMENDTYAFYLRGWSGINIEPNEGFFDLLTQQRPRDRNLCMILSDTDEEQVTYFESDGTGLSTCDERQAGLHAAAGLALKRRQRRVSTLAQILAQALPGKIDLLKVDVEGFEEKVLAGNDWERFRPDIVLVEATYPNRAERRPTQIRGFMEQRGYRHVLFDGLNDFYVEQNVKVPDDISLPPNVFDRYILRELSELRRHGVAATDAFKSAEAYALSLKAEVDKLAAERDGLRDQAMQELAARQALEQTVQDLGALQRQNEQLKADVQDLGADREALKQQNEQLKADLQNLGADRQALQQQNEQLKAEVQDLIAERSALPPQDVFQRRLQDSENRVKALEEALATMSVGNRRLAHETDNLTADIHRLSAAATQMRAEILAMGRAVQDRDARIDAQEAAERRLREQAHRDYQAAQGEFAQAREQAHRDYQAAQSELAQAREWIRAIHASTSWTLTRPWRYLGRKLGR